MEAELKPCEDCGGRPKATILMGDRIATCETPTCGNKGIPYLDDDWNKRAPGGSEGPVDVGTQPLAIEDIEPGLYAYSTQAQRDQARKVVRALMNQYPGLIIAARAALASKGAPEGKEGGERG